MQQTSVGGQSCGIHHEPRADGATTRQPSSDGEDKASFSRSAVLTFGQRPSTLRTGDLLEVELNRAILCRFEILGIPADHRTSRVRSSIG